MKKLYMLLLALFLASNPLVHTQTASAGPVMSQSVGGKSSLTVTSSHNRVIRMDVQVEWFNTDKIRADLSIHCLNGANPRQEYQCSIIEDGEITLYHETLPNAFSPEYWCGNGNIPCQIPSYNYSDQVTTHYYDTYYAYMFIQKVQSFDDLITNAQLSGPTVLVVP